MHNRHLGRGAVLRALLPVHRTAKKLAAVVVPSEYGMTRVEKLSIGASICSELVGRSPWTFEWRSNGSLTALFAGGEDHPRPSSGLPPGHLVQQVQVAVAAGGGEPGPSQPAPLD